MKNILYITFLFLLTATSCQKVIDLKVDDTEPKIVLEARYDATKEEVWVRISKTIDVFSAENYPQIKGAQVEIIDENGVSTPLADQGDGTYLFENYVPIFDSEYAIKIVVDGETYEASDYLKNVVPLDSLSTEFQEASAFSEEGYVVFMNATDPFGSNYYGAIRKVNGEYRKELGDEFLFDDSFSEGNTQSVPIFSELYQVGDTVQIELNSYSEKTYNYLNQLRAIASGSEVSAAPANPVNQWSKEALGHFSAFGYDTKTIIIAE
ncbi:DUF4249 domain-containing protein [Brumimicrobium oceani]|uniref:DUF4249 domain-containing protein n=1 Tax=Brumimicrobium oceani TaxID=2100725 RepID=A0A2U2XH18_9FLAO|nr:DUF4249 domain-containing protein [Brumimicrobium oceani]PWH87085.1 hypothetical protein DIT68_02145 [Brumimicrobium oceani]